jgi:hypothetical protein
MFMNSEWVVQTKNGNYQHRRVGGADAGVTREEGRREGKEGGEKEGGGDEYVQYSSPSKSPPEI